MATIEEIAPDLFRLSVFVPALDMQFNHFLVPDEEPLLFHAGFRRMFPELREAVGTLICSDLFHHFGDVEAVTTSDLIGRTQLPPQRGRTAARGRAGRIGQNALVSRACPVELRPRRESWDGGPPARAATAWRRIAAPISGRLPCIARFRAASP